MKWWPKRYGTFSTIEPKTNLCNNAKCVTSFAALMVAANNHGQSALL